MGIKASSRMLGVVGLFFAILLLSISIAWAAGPWSASPSSRTTLVGVWGGNQCKQVTVAHPVTLPRQGRGRFGGLPYPATVAAAGRINLMLFRHFSTISSGVSLSNDNTTINVFATALPRRLRIDIAKLAPLGSVSYRKCGNTLSSLYAIQRALSVGIGPPDQLGIDIAGYGTTITSNCEEIDVLRLTRPQLALLQHDFGVNRICVHGITRQQVGEPI